MVELPCASSGSAAASSSGTMRLATNTARPRRSTTASTAATSTSMDKRGTFYLLPPLLALYPTSFSAGNLIAGIGGSVAVDPNNGDIWGTDYSGRRMNRLRPLR